jgi:hypothetical protein
VAFAAVARLTKATAVAKSKVFIDNPLGKHAWVYLPGPASLDKAIVSVKPLSAPRQENKVDTVPSNQSRQEIRLYGVPIF